MRVCVLGSGSKGNCTLVSEGGTHVLVDCGLSARRTVAALRSFGVDPHSLAAILVSHEHADHVCGLRTFLRHHDVPLMASEGTDAGIAIPDAEPRRVTFRTGADFSLGGLEVTTFPVSHDSADPCGFVFRSATAVAAHVTDFGCMTEVVRQRVRGAGCLVIESNHDEEMLKVGRYPWDLKRRILGRLGHLSNRTLARFFLEDFDGAARHVVLAHLSAENNHPGLALSSAEEALSHRFGPGAGRPQVHVAAQDRPTPLLEF